MQNLWWWGEVRSAADDGASTWLPATLWEIEMQFLAPGFSLAQP